MSGDGRFVVVTGIDGAGKSTVIEGLTELISPYHHVTVTREPGGTELAEEIRSVLLKHRDEAVDPLTELFLIFAARNQHYQRVIKPAIDQGDFVLCSRWVESSRGYQGARGLPFSTVNALEQMVCGDYRPDLTLLLDIDPEISLGRASERAELDRIEQESIDFFASVRRQLLDQTNGDYGWFAIVDATQTPEEVLEQSFAYIEEAFFSD